MAMTTGLKITFDRNGEQIVGNVATDAELMLVNAASGANGGRTDGCDWGDGVCFDGKLWRCVLGNTINQCRWFSSHVHRPEP